MYILSYEITQIKAKSSTEKRKVDYVTLIVVTSCRIKSNAYDVADLFDVAFQITFELGYK
ncbi:hypothetical protein T03_13748 [Trichinella britovi]|uniref:Uncharacterized protein n=1 Tax=Trichinella britovi TaxID=45882 RepID=A0A0V1BAH4_TRIBR|nr:hypothetical protein T03_13748 [Trichinella britovi]